MEYGLCVLSAKTDLTKPLRSPMGRLARSTRLPATPCESVKQATNRRKATLNEGFIDRYPYQNNVRFETAHEVAISLAAAGISYEQQMADLAAEIRRERLTRSA